MANEHDSPSPPATASVPERAAPDPKTRDWIFFEFVPALNEMAEALERYSRLDFELLVEAGSALSGQERQAWIALLRRLEDQARKNLGLAASDAPLPVRFVKALGVFFRHDAAAGLQAFKGLLKGLNDHWFLERRIVLLWLSSFGAPSSYQASATPAGVRVTQLVERYSARFAEGEIPILAVAGYDGQVPENTSGFYDRAMGYVVLEVNNLTRETLRAELLARGDPTVLRYFRVDKPASLAQVSRCQALWHLYPQHASLYAALFSRTSREEVRHAMDSCRAKEQMRNSEPFHDALGRRILALQGRLRRLLWGGEARRMQEKTFLGVPFIPGKVVSELSAQMTAAACGEPRIVLLEWWQFLAGMNVAGVENRRAACAESPEHALADVLGTVLLAEALHLGASLSEQVLLQPDFDALAAAAGKLFGGNVGEVRLALKSVYQAEFNFPIDEAPFAEITADGSLHPRPEMCQEAIGPGIAPLNAAGD